MRSFIFSLLIAYVVPNCEDEGCKKFFQGDGACVDTATLDWSALSGDYDLAAGTGGNVCTSECNCHCLKKVTCPIPSKSCNKKKGQCVASTSTPPTGWYYGGFLCDKKYQCRCFLQCKNKKCAKKKGLCLIPATDDIPDGYKMAGACNTKAKCNCYLPICPPNPKCEAKEGTCYGKGMIVPPGSKYLGYCNKKAKCKCYKPQRTTTTTSTTTSTTSIPSTSSCPTNSDLVDDSVLFIAGGLRTEVTALSEDTLTSLGVPLKPLPKETWGPALAYHDGYVYLCGQVFGQQENLCMKYDRVLDNWSPIQNFPYVNAYTQGESANGNLYVFGGNGGRTNVHKYNAEDDTWIILSAKIPFDFLSGCSTVIGGCRVLLITFTGKTAVFDAVTETFLASSGFPIVSTMSHCAASLGKVSDAVGVMVTDASFGKKTQFFQLEPPGSGQWEAFSTNNGYLGPVLGRVSEKMMILGGSRGRDEVFPNSPATWEDKALQIPFPTYGRSTQVPKSWMET